MPRLSHVMKQIREALGTSQKEIAERVEITQSAIAQFERSESKLSREKLLQIAPLLNLNPAYVEEGIGNMFRNPNKETVIEMVLQATSDNQVDYTLIDYIADSNDKALFILLKPTGLIDEEGNRVRKWRDQGRTTFALAIEDADENLFLLKKKDSSFFNDNELVQYIKKLSRGEGKTIEVASEPISRTTFKTFQTSDPVARAKEIKDIVLRHAYRDQHRFLVQVIKRAAPIDQTTSEELDRMLKKVAHMDPKLLKLIYEDAIQQIMPFLKKNI